MRKILIVLTFLSFATMGFAQTLKDIKINEVLVNNVDSYMDDYGHRSSWIELHNTSHGKIKINGCYLRVRKVGGELISYRIPSDPRTEMGELDYAIFFCDGYATKGTFYTNFTLDDVDMIWLVNSNGKEIIDELPINISAQVDDVSIGRSAQKEGGVVVIKALPQMTPLATNDTEETLPKHEQFRRVDPTGAIMTITAITVVFSSLTFLFLFFKYFGNYMIYVGEKKKRRAAGNSAKVDAKTVEVPTNSEQIAAIALSMELYMNDLHDKESIVLTINRVARTYSPWSSKIYSMRQIPPRK